VIVVVIIIVPTAVTLVVVVVSIAAHVAVVPRVAWALSDVDGLFDAVGRSRPPILGMLDDDRGGRAGIVGAVVVRRCDDTPGEPER
jgi:hypothetical protein